MNNKYYLLNPKKWQSLRTSLCLGFLISILSINQLSAQVFCDNCSGTNGPCAFPSIANNDDLDASCTGMKILFVIDESGSTNGFQTEIEEAVMTFLESLQCVGVNMAVIEFNATARYVRPTYTLVDDAFIDGMQDYFDDDLSSTWTNQIFEPLDQDSDGDTDNCTNSNPFCATNWQAALLAADALSTPDLVLFFTDGVPTSYSTGSNPSFNNLSTVSICGDGSNTQRPEIVNAMKLANKLKNEGAHFFALGIGAFTGANQIQLERISGTDGYDPNDANSNIRNADFAADSFDQLAECLATFADDLCEFDSDVSASDGCPGDDDGELQIQVPANLLPVTYTYDGPGGNDGNGSSNTSPITISNLPAGAYEITVEISLGSNCTRTETFFETIGSQVCSGTPTIDCPDDVTYDCNPTLTNNIPDAIPDPAAEIAAGNVTGNNPNCDVIITHDGDSQVMQDANDDCLFYIIRTYRVDNKCGGGTNTCTQRFEWTISDLSLSTCPADVDLDGCTDQTTLDDAWSNWIAGLNGMSANNGCNAVLTFDPPINTLTKPNICPSSPYEQDVIITAEDDCQEVSCTTTFTLAAYAQDLTLDACPDDPNLDGCSTDGEITTAWNAWITALEAMDASGGCSPVITYDPPLNTLTQPDDCASITKEISVKVTATDLCETKECTATFTLQAAPTDLALEACPTDPNLDGCSTDSEIETAWDAWLLAVEGVGATGGCSPVISYDPPLNQLVKPDQCADSKQEISVKITATDLCETKECTATFTLQAYADDLVLDDCPPAVELDGCTSDAEVGTAWSNWISELESMEATGSCASTITYDPPLSELIQPTQCGAEDQVVKVKVTAADLCSQKECTTSFTLKAYPDDLTLSDCPSDEVSGCLTQDEIDARFDTWIANLEAMISGGTCPQTITYDPPLDQLISPEKCSDEDQVIKVTVTASDLCESVSCEAIFTLIVDDEPPVITDAMSRVEECGPGDDDAFQAWLDNNGGATATDNCGDVHWNYEILEYEPGCCSTGEWKVKFTATDDCDNSSSTVAQFKIVDTTAPEIECPADVTDIPCGTPLPEPDIHAVHTSDNCVCSDEVWVEWEGDVSNHASGCEGDPIIITRTYRATDACGNSDVCHQRFIYREDIVDPMITVEAADETVECDGDGNTAALEAWLEGNGGAEATDDCNDIRWDYEVVGTEEGCGGSVVYTATFTVTDACGNDSETTANFIIEDTTPPTIDLDASDKTVECDGAGNVAEFQDWLANQGGAQASDICSGVDWSYEIDEETDECGLTKRYKVIFTATDDCNNSSQTMAYFIIEDTTPPTMDVEASDLTVECDGAGNQEELQAWLNAHGGAQASDDCGDVSWTMQISEKMDDCGNTGYMTFMFTAKDKCGNETPTTATFTIIDETAPEITTPAANEVVECDGTGNVDALQAWLDDKGGAEASDMCGGISWTYEMSSEPGCGGTEVITAVFTVTDDCGNPSQTSATFTIEDNTNPVIEAPATADIACDDLLPAIDDAVVYDECSGVTVESSIDPYEVDVCNGYQVTYRWIATDDCGNSSAATSTFNVLPDTDAPVITPVHPAIADLPNGGTLPPVECNNADPDWNPFTMTEDAVEAWDDCSGVTVTFTDELVEDGCDSGADFVSKWICTWTATDECGNSSSYSVYMLIVDTAPPVFDQQPEDVTVGCGEMPDMPEVTAQDACSDVEISYAISSSPGECAGERMVIRIWTAEDACGNKSYLYQRILQIDTEAPRIILRDDLNDYEDGDEIYVDCEDFNDYIFLESAARAMDNCDDDPEISYDFRLYSPESNCEAKGYTRKLEIEWTATDGCGNATTLGLTIYGVDETAPVFDEAPSIICATSDNIPAAEGVTATDACGAVDLSVSDADASDCDDGSVIERTWVAVDNCGNTAEFVQMIVLDDEAAPTITVNHPAFEGASSGDEVVVPADCASGNEYALPDIANLIEVTDACTGDGEATITVALDEEGSCEVGFLYALTLTIEAADACGNTTTATYLLKVQDMEGPDFTGTPASLTLDCGEAYPDPTVVDACGGLISLSVEDSGDPDVCNATGDPMIRTWTAEDACGNISTFVQSIYIVDNTPPVFVGLPDDECIEDGVIPDAPEVTAVDDCDGEAAAVEMVETVENGDCGQVVTRTWTTTDACGNEASAVQYLIETDTEAPSIEFIHPDLDHLSSGATLEMSCVNFQDDNVPDYDASAVSVSDNCAADIAVGFTYELVGLGDCLTDGYLERYKLTWTATDPCGNSSSVELYVNAIDNSPPVVFERPASVVNLYCDEPIPAPMELFVVDNCSGVTVDYVEETTYPSPGMTAIGRTWTATDDCGNTEIVTQWIKIQDYELECHFLNYENEVTCGSDDNTITVAVTGGTAPYTYQWDLVDCDGIMVEGMDGPTLTFLAGFTPLNFVVEVTDANGCSTTCTLTVPCSKDKGNHSSQGVGVGLGNGGGLGNGPGPIRPGGNLVVFPNPSTGQYYLQFEHSFDKPTRIIVQNLMGQHVQVTKFDYITAEPIQLDITELPDGMYTIMVEVDGVINSAHKVIKEQ